MGNNLVELTEKKGQLYHEDTLVNVLHRGLAHIIFIDDNKIRPKNQADLIGEVSRIKIDFKYEDANAYHLGFAYEASPKEHPDKKCAIPVQFYKIMDDKK